MKRYQQLVVCLILIVTITFGIGMAESETTYYMYDGTEWRVCTDSEAVFAQEAFTKEYPVSLSREDMEALLRSHEPYIHSYGRNQTLTPEPTPTPTPTPAPAWTPAPVPDGFWRSILDNTLPSRDYNLPSRWFSRAR